MNRQTFALALAGSLATAMATDRRRRAAARRADGRQGEVLRHRAQGPERLRRRRRHHLRRHLDHGLPGQCLEGRSGRHLHLDECRGPHGHARADEGLSRLEGPGRPGLSPLLPIAIPGAPRHDVSFALPRAPPCPPRAGLGLKPEHYADDPRRHGRMSASSRCMPRTTWATAAPPHRALAAIARALSAVAARRRPVDRRGAAARPAASGAAARADRPLQAAVLFRASGLVDA